MLELLIKSTWDSQQVKHEFIKLTLSQSNSDPNLLNIDIEAPFFNSPEKPNFKPGDFFPLWDYEG